MNTILVLGADGYLGWPLSMHFSSLGYRVIGVDNYARRTNSVRLGIKPLYETPLLEQRCRIWKNTTGLVIEPKIGDLSDPYFTESLFSQLAVDLPSQQHKNTLTILHLAEQPSAPLSIIDIHSSNYTLTNNISTTNNILWGCRKHFPSAHLVKLGTMGEYGTPNIDIEEGWLDITHNNRTDKFLFPRQASSVYHTSKIMDTDLIWWAVRSWGLRVTDLMQGPVYGLTTPQTSISEKLSTIFNYDEVFGTVLNRFVVQAAIGYPLTIYGSGNQTRGYLNLNDTLQCITKTVENPPEAGELRIFNQITQTFSVNDLANLVVSSLKDLLPNISVKHLPNPRKEAEDHYYNPTYQALSDIGVVPMLLNEEIIRKMYSTVSQYVDNIDKSLIFNGIKW